ncbi:hypothetical protein LCGC14_1311420 [marine sediment metagenome]|uniref:Uncharacterized protein n=1 Tax=marine sediment metagenome TaxID=412755 RepID=A0A0F9N348_9ZZZZ
MKSYPCRVSCNQGVVKILSVQTNKYVLLPIDKCSIKSIKQMKLDGKFDNGKSWIMNLTQFEMNKLKGL